MTSVGIGTLVGIDLGPLVILVFAALRKALALVFRPATTDRAPDSGSPG